MIRKYIIEADDSIKGFDEGIARLEREWGAEEIEHCEDCIRRKEAIDKNIKYFHDEYYQRTSIQECRSCFVNDVLLKLPAIQPARPKGEWIASTEYGSILHKCSKCHKYNDWESNFCPNCGADMRGD